MTRPPRFALDTLLLAGLLALAAAAFGHGWLLRHPEHDPWAPLELDHPPGWATAGKLAKLRADPPACRAVLARSGIAFAALPPAGAGDCRRADRLVLADDLSRGLRLRPATPPATCAVGAGLAHWLRHGVQPAAAAHLGSQVAAIEHYGAYSCRRVYGGATGGWSQHATGNAIDVAGFVLADGRRIGVRRDWGRGGDAAAFLRAARDAACNSFATVLSPDYNAAHADHFHLDQAPRRGWRACR